MSALKSASKQAVAWFVINLVLMLLFAGIRGSMDAITIGIALVSSVVGGLMMFLWRRHCLRKAPARS
jgi:formate hydrogenlyase subunit 3/multisubunit Na+/H+ antiporter MnhD subunit